VNYLEHTHHIAAVPYGFYNARFHATEYEKKWAAAVRKALAPGPVIVWCVNGSSAHKVYPWVQIVAAWLLERTPARIVLYGDPGVGKALQKGIMLCLKDSGADMSRVLGIAGDWTIRQSLAFLEQADCVVGPETGPMNAAAMLPVPKVIYLSHSSAENLTKHWANTVSLTPPVDRAPCFPCHRLHFDWTHCNKDETTGAAACASGISPEIVFKAIAQAVIARQAA
jgi:ADP-heptose:LPS heptosyltransferase